MKGQVGLKTDITLKITEKMALHAKENLNKANFGHLGTHFDVMNKEFPLEYTECAGVVFDVSGIKGRDIDIPDVDMGKVHAGMFVIFYTGYIETVEYGTKAYFAAHPQLSGALIDALLDTGIFLLGIDCAGVRCGAEHTPKDFYCAQRGVFIIENLCNLAALPGKENLLIHTYPLSRAGWSGLPCRVIAEESGAPSSGTA